MPAFRSSLVAPEVVIEHVSAAGAMVTHVRGTLVAHSRDNIREIGMWQQYEAALPTEHREAILYAIPASWLPVEVALSHYNTCDQLALDAAQITRLGELMAARVIDTFLGSALRAARQAGADSFWALLKTNDRMYDRMYLGGGVTLLQTGPKDLILENSGQPLASCRYWRGAYLAYMIALGNAFAKVAFVKLVRPRIASPYGIAVAGSWV